MERIADLNLTEEEVFKKAKMLVTKVRRASAENPPNLESAIKILENLRREIYEDLNQIQHEAMILRAGLVLQRSDLINEDVEWYWNPRQRGGAEEPDLRGIIAGQIKVSAEVTASEKPEGTIERRMQATLSKLSKMRGKRIYFVRTQAMEKRARSKVKKAGYQIEVQRI